MKCRTDFKTSINEFDMYNCIYYTWTYDIPHTHHMHFFIPVYIHVCRVTYPTYMYTYMYMCIYPLHVDVIRMLDRKEVMSLKMSILCDVVNRSLESSTTPNTNEF